MKDSVFTKIINGDIPCIKVYEDEDTMAIMDIFPVQEGMVVVFPKKQIRNVEDLDDNTAAKVMQTVHKIMKALRKQYPDATKIAVQVAGFQTPDHAHFTVYPANTVEEFHAPSPTAATDRATLEPLAQSLRNKL